MTAIWASIASIFLARSRSCPNLLMGHSVQECLIRRGALRELDGSDDGL
jgi:hypothetical protein